MRIPELLVPAGNLEKLQTALLYGADAVYIGVPGLSLRAPSAEMSPDDIARGVREAHKSGAKIYAALNTFARNSDVTAANRIIPELNGMGIDALILSDPGLIRLVRSIAPHLPIHLSTQANTTNTEAVRFWQDQGVKRIILARELTLNEIGHISAGVPEVEIEVFIHGAMCMAYSGRCYLSAYRNQKSANAGDCTQPCRWEYVLHESTRPDEPFILEEDERFSYLLSSRDLCLIEHLPDIIQTGVASVKIEGRMKSSYYLAVVTRTYRQALDAFRKKTAEFQCDPAWIEELKTVSHRGYTTGFALGAEKITATSPDIKNIQTHEPAGVIQSYDAEKRQALIEVRNFLQAGDDIELLLPDKTLTFQAQPLLNENGNSLDQAHAGNRIFLALPCPAPQGTILRKRITSGKG